MILLIHLANPNPQVYTIDLTYDFAFDDSQIAIVLWTECKYIAESIGIDINMAHWFDIFHKLDIQYNKVSLTIHDLIELSLIIQTITCIYNTYKTLTDDFHNGKVTPAKLCQRV